MADRLATLTASRATAWEEMNALRTAIGDTAGSAEQRQEWDRIEADITNFGDAIEQENRARELDRIAKIPVTDRIDPEAAPTKADGIDEARYAAAFQKMMRRGMAEGNTLTTEERQMLQARFENRAQAEGTTTAGGYLVPQGYRATMTETMKAFGGFMALANVITTATGNVLPWPSNNDTGNLGGLLSENTQITELDLAIGTNQLSAWTYTSGLVLASLQLLQDSAFDLDTWLPTKLGTRLGRGIAVDLVSGSGTNRPLGINLAPTVGVTAATGGSLTVTYNNLVDLEHSVDAAYRQLGNCRFVMNDLALGAIRKLVDTTGRPLWDPGFASIAGPPQTTILGYPVTIDNAMPVMGPNAKSILFGDFHQGYIVRNVLDPTIMRLTERYADFLQVGFFGFQRIDGRPDDAAAVRAFVNSAT